MGQRIAFFGLHSVELDAENSEVINKSNRKVNENSTILCGRAALSANINHRGVILFTGSFLS